MNTAFVYSDAHKPTFILINGSAPVMTENLLKTILAALPGVDAAQVTLGRDSETGEPTAEVSLREEQLELVLRENGRYVREAAMTTGVRIDVSLATGGNA